MRKYEGKSSVARFNAPLGAICRWCAVNRLLGEASMLFILAAKSFSEMFTTYSHALCPSSPAGLRLEIRSKIDKKKMNFIFCAAKKIS